MLHMSILNPLILAPTLIGIITLFGKKKKEEPQQPEEPQAATGQVSNDSRGNQNSSPLSSSYPPARPFQESGEEVNRSPPEGPLNKLLQSLLNEMPTGQSTASEGGFEESLSTPDWVPSRATPPSRPMVLVPDDTGKKVLQPVGQQEQTTVPKPAPTPVMDTSPKQAPAIPSTIPTRIPVPEDSRKPEKFGATRKEAELKPSQAPSPPRPIESSGGFGRLFELTQSALLSPGLVLVSGVKGVGKTSLCISLSDAYFKQGSPCLFVEYDRSTASLREKMKTLGCDPSPGESSFRFLMIDGFSAQSESFSMEPYYVEKPLDLENLQDVVARNAGMFTGEKLGIILDSLDPVASKIPVNEVVRKLTVMAGKMRELGATFVVTVTYDQLSKELAGALEDLADCVLDLEKSGSGGRLKVRKLKGATSKPKPEDFEIDSGKGMVFA